jgi:hypothetical protein
VAGREGLLTDQVLESRHCLTHQVRASAHLPLGITDSPTGRATLNPIREPLETADIVEANGGSAELYSHWDPDEREQVDLDEYPLYDEDGLELPVFDESGYPVKRVRMFEQDGQDPPALLADISLMHDMFEADEEGLDDSFRSGPMYAYPQAFTRFGNVQSQTPMPAFQARVALVSQSVRRENRNAREPIECHNFQGYNYESHRTRAAASTHVAQTGPLTAMFGGSVCHPKPSTKFKAALQRYNTSGKLPFEDLERKILLSDLSIGAQFRKEVVYVINMSELTPKVRDCGRYVLLIQHLTIFRTCADLSMFASRELYEEVIYPLALQWRHGSVLYKFRQSLVVFQPGVCPSSYLCYRMFLTMRLQIFPDIYVWVTYGLTSLMMRMVKEARCHLDLTNITQVSPFLTEFMAIIERSYNFAHTGSAKVVVRKLMDQTWLSLGLKHDSFPALSPTFARMLTPDANMSAHLARIWPLDSKTGEPMTTSGRSHKLNFGLESWEVRRLTSVAKPC